VTDVPWVVTAYVVAAAATTPLWGKLGDRHGRKRLLETSLVMFLGASAVCGLAQDLTVLVIARVVQGAAAGGLMTLAYAAVGDLVSPRERGRYQGYIAMTFAVATVIGPLLGGLLVDHASWRWVFYVNLPIGLLALVGLRLRLPAAEVDPADRALDLAGAILLAGATTALMLACIWGGDRYAWGSPTIVGLGVAFLVLAVALAIRERRAADPIVPLGVLRRPAVAVSSAALFLVTATIFSITVFVPLLLQTATGATPTEAGLVLVAMMVGVTLSTNVVGRSIERSGRYKRFPVTGLALIAAALALMAVLAGDPTRAGIAIALVIFGLGFGMVGQVLTVAVQNGVDRKDLGVAMAATTFFRALGGAIGTAVLGAVFAARADVIDGIQTVFLVAAPIALVALVIVLRLEEVPLQSGREPSGREPSGRRVSGEAAPAGAGR
jgi:EmrB/QacA subfamily drug resistance transporter